MKHNFTHPCTYQHREKSIFSIVLACSAQFKSQKKTQTIVPPNYEQNWCCVKLHSEEMIITNKSWNKFQYPTATKLLAANLTKQYQVPNKWQSCELQHKMLWQKPSTTQQGQRCKHNKLTKLDSVLPNKDKSCQLHTKSHHKNSVPVNREEVATQTSK